MASSFRDIRNILLVLSVRAASGIAVLTGRKQHVFARRVAQLDTILDYMDHWVAAKPDKCFSAFLDRHGNPRETYTYQSFEARTRFLAEYIHDEAALQRGDRVALVYPPGLEMVASFVACARMGVIPVPVPPVTSVAKGGASRLRSVILDSQASLALTDSSLGSAPIGRSEVGGHADSDPNPRVSR